MKIKEKNFASAVIYVHNSEATVAPFLKTIISVMQDNFEHSEIICVNDCSTDNSMKAVKELSKTAASTSISVVNMSYFHGIEIAMNAGMDLAIGDFVFEFDNTILDFDPEEIMNVYFHLLKGYDIVCAVPDRKERLSSRLFYKVFEHMSDAHNRLHTESFRVLSRRVLNRINAMSKSVPYRKAIYANTGLKTDSVTYKCKGKVQSFDAGEKHYRSTLAQDSLILFTSFGYRFSIAMTVAMMIFSILMILYTIIVYLTATPVAGWTTTILFLAIAFFGTFGILTIIIKYLQTILNLIFKRKQYSFESIEKLTK